MENEELKTLLRVLIENLIADERVDGFLLGGEGRFPDLCCDIVRDMQRCYDGIMLTRCAETAYLDTIHNSCFCPVYYDEYDFAVDRDTVCVALEYAVSLRKTIIHVPLSRKGTVL